MTTTRLYMSVSLDGFIAGPDDSPDDPMGVGGFRLFDWLDRRAEPGPSGELYAEMLTSRAVIAGRRTYELAGHWHGDHHDGVPILILTHEVPADPQPEAVRFFTDAASCAAYAREVVGDGLVAVMGAGAAQSLLAAGQLDELELSVVPVLLGRGRRLFDHLPAGTIELELLRQLRTPDTEDPHRQALHLRYRVTPR